MARHEIKQNDTRPYWPVTLTYEDGTAVNFSGGSVLFKARRRSDGQLKINVAATVTDGAAGQCEWRPLATETDEAGRFDCEWQVTFSDGTIQTFPTRRYDTLIVKGDLDS